MLKQGYSCSIAALLLLTVGSPVGRTWAQALLEVQWGAKLQLSDLSEIEQRIQQPEPLAVPGRLLAMSKDQGSPQQSRVVTNCHDYLLALADGLTAQSSDQDQENIFIGDCYLLRELQHAKPSTVSYVPHTWPPDVMDIVPPLFHVTDSVAIADLKKPWSSIPGIHLGGHEDGSFEVNDQSFGYNVETLGWGDFNGDGFEDLAVAVTASAKEGTLRMRRYYVLTRCQSNGMLTFVSAPQNTWAPIGPPCS